VIEFWATFGLAQLLFALGLRAETHRKLLATALASPLWALLCLFPLVDVLKSDQYVLAIIATAAVGLVDAAVFAVAVARLRHRHIGRAPAPQR
jgi:hypothetical protein